MLCNHRNTSILENGSLAGGGFFLLSRANIMKGKKIIMCSQCNEEFENGYDYRMHWEKEHFYPYIVKNGFDFESAKKDIKRDYGKESK